MRGYFAPEYASPAVVSVVSKSGTNDIHGAAWEFLRNDKLDARNTFDFAPQKPPYRQNQFGASISGPLIKNKLFAIGNFELLKVRQAFTTSLLVPTPAMLQGDFSGANSIYDPATANAQKIKQVFPNNIIPAGRIGEFAQKYNDFVLTSPISPQDPAVRARGLTLSANSA